MICRKKAARFRIIHKRTLNPLHARHLPQIPGKVPGIFPVHKGYLPFGKQPRSYIALSQGIPDGNLIGEQFIFSKGRNHFIIDKHIIITAVIHQRQLHIAVSLRPKGQIFPEDTVIRKPSYNLLPLGIPGTQRIRMGGRIGVADHRKAHIMFCIRSYQQAHRRPQGCIHVPHSSLQHKGTLLLNICVFKITSVCHTVMIQNPIISGSLIKQKGTMDPLHFTHLGQAAVRIRRIGPAGKRRPALGKQSQLYFIPASQGIPDGNLTGEQFILVKSHSQAFIDKHIVTSVLIGQTKLHLASGAKRIVICKRLYIGEPLYQFLPVGISHTERILVRSRIRVSYNRETHIMFRIASHQQSG